MGCHIFTECSNLFRKRFLRLSTESSYPKLQSLPRCSEQSLPLFRLELARQRDGGELCGMKNLVRVGIPDTAEETGISEGPFQRVIFRSQDGSKGIQIAGKNVNSSSVKSTQSFLPFD